MEAGEAEPHAGMPSYLYGSEALIGPWAQDHSQDPDVADHDRRKEQAFGDVADHAWNRRKQRDLERQTVELRLRLSPGRASCEAALEQGGVLLEDETSTKHPAGVRETRFREGNGKSRTNVVAEELFPGSGVRETRSREGNGKSRTNVVAEELFQGGLGAGGRMPEVEVGPGRQPPPEDSIHESAHEEMDEELEFLLEDGDGARRSSSKNTNTNSSDHLPPLPAFVYEMGFEYGPWEILKNTSVLQNEDGSRTTTRLDAIGIPVFRTKTPYPLDGHSAPFEADPRYRRWRCRFFTLVFVFDKTCLPPGDKLETDSSAREDLPGRSDTTVRKPRAYRQTNGVRNHGVCFVLFENGVRFAALGAMQRVGGGVLNSAAGGDVIHTSMWSSG